MLITATLQRTSNPVRPATGWFIPGSEPASWLEEVARWPVPSDQLRFFLVASPHSTDCAGALVLPPAEMSLPTGSRAQPYGELRRGFFVPIAAEVSPPFSDDELASQCCYPVTLFHPSLGLTGFEASAERRAEEFLAAPPTANENWSRARAIVPPNDRLRAVRLSVTLSLEDLFGEESKEIGSQPPADLPPLPEEAEHHSRPSKLVQGASDALAKVLLALAKVVPRKPGIAPTWVNQLENWAQKKLSGLGENLDQIRQQELERLLRLLQTDPDEGLRHAISLAQLTGRGRAAPSAKLGRRDLDFNLRRLGGGGPSDAWNVPAEVRTNLAKRYREAAQREAKLGHYRRAACIYAELLGDLGSAANVLREGRCFKEAALLYSERLHNPLLAAACYADGGLVQEAIALYEKYESWIPLADLHSRLGATEAARVALRRAVASCLSKNDVLSAAKLLETRLQEPDEALALLTTAWPRSRHALRALEERLALLARLNRHEAIATLCANLGRETQPPASLTPLVSMLIKVVETATDERVRRSAGQTVQAKVSLGLAETGLKPADELILLRAITRLAPQDRLLSRDVKRFRESRPRVPSRPPPLPAKPAPLRKLILEKGASIVLPVDSGWLKVMADSTGFQALGSDLKKQLTFLRGTWKKEFQSTSWSDPASELKGTFLMASYGAAVVLSRPFAEKLSLHRLPHADAFLPAALEVGTPLWIPNDAIQASAARSTLWVIRVVGTRVILASYDVGKDVRSLDVTDELTAAGASGGGTSLCLDASAVPGQIALAFGQHVLVKTENETLKVRDLGARVIGLLPVKGSVPGWIALLERGAVLVSPGLAKTSVIDDTLELPRGAFLSGDRLVLASETEGRVIRLQAGANLAQGWFQLEGDPGFALTATDHPEEFALFHASGRVQRWRLT